MKVNESQIIDMIKDVVEVDEVSMDQEGLIDSMNMMQFPSYLSKTYGIDASDEAYREIFTAKTPRILIELMKKHGIA